MQTKWPSPERGPMVCHLARQQLQAAPQDGRPFTRPFIKTLYRNDLCPLSYDDIQTVYQAPTFRPVTPPERAGPSGLDQSQDEFKCSKMKTGLFITRRTGQDRTGQDRTGQDRAGQGRAG